MKRNGQDDSNNREENGEEDEEDYYALLNLPRNATRDEIKAQYMHLAKVLHPDKHVLFQNRASAEDKEQLWKALDAKEEAQRMFLKVNNAYKVLMSGREREIYDDLGFAGLRALEKLERKEGQHVQENTVGAYDRLSENLREKLIGRVLLEHEIAEMEKFNVRGMIRTDLNALDFHHLKLPSVTQIVVQQSVDIPITSKDVLSLAAYSVAASNGKGIGNFSFGHEHQFSNHTSIESTVIASMDDIGISVKGNRTYSMELKGSMEFIYKGGQSGLNFEATRSLTPTLSGIMRFGIGEHSGVSLQLVRRESYIPAPPLWYRYRERRAYAEHILRGGTKDDFAFELSPPLRNKYFQQGRAGMQVGSDGLGINLSCVQSLTEKSFGRLDLTLSTESIRFKVSSSRSFHTGGKGGASLGIGLKGIVFTVFFTRKNLEYVFPVRISESFSIIGFLTAGIVPTMMNYAFRRVYEPYHKRRCIQDEIKEAKKLNQVRMTAKLQMGIMARNAQVQKEAEERSNGMIILIARYGLSRDIYKSFPWLDVKDPSESTLPKSRKRVPSDWDEDNSKEIDDDFVKLEENEDENAYETHPTNIDVTNQLQFFVKESKLVLNAASKARLMGFYNPLHGRNYGEPVLYIRYRLASWVYEITYQDSDPIELPDPRAMLIGNTFNQGAVDWTK